MAMTVAILSLYGPRGAAQQLNTKPAVTAQPAQAGLGNGPLPYDLVVPAGSKTSKGFVRVHRVKDRYLFEIPDSLFGRLFYTVNRIARSAQDWRNPLGGICSYGNDWIGNSMFCFEKSAKDKVALKLISTGERAEGNDPEISKALAGNNFEPVYARFAVKAYNRQAGSTVIDLTDYLNGDNEVFGYSSDIKMIAMPGAFAPERSFLNSVTAYPDHIEVSSTRTYAAGTTSLSGEYNSSIVLLERKPIRGRAYDERVGYFGLGPSAYRSYDADGHILERANIWRWRLEPKEQDREAYFKGVLVEPARPIVFYIDPATPKKWVPYLIAGVNDWQKAFEKAGFKNAIMAREVDPRDSTFNINDSHHNVIVYKASALANAMGHSLQDPRSGEIIESHIQWYHSVMEVLYKWYFCQAGAIDTAARKPRFSDELMGQLIRFVSSHEVGHAVGLRHNWGASSTTSIAQLRDRSWVEAHGHTPSIMDYARFNYVAQPGDGIGQSGIFPRIGDYDIWAIEWGYRLLPDGLSEEQEKKMLEEWFRAGPGRDKRLRFGIGDDLTARYPQNQREDLGDDAVAAGSYGIRNLKLIKKNLMDWTQVPGGSYDHVSDVYKALIEQYDWYIRHAAAYIGGMVFQPDNGSGQPFYGFEPALKQRRALAFLNRELFSTPEWLRDDRLYRLGSVDFSLIEAVQRKTLKALLDDKLFARLRLSEIAQGKGAYGLQDFLTELRDGIFSELYQSRAISANRRILQKVYVNELVGLTAQLARSDGDGVSLLKSQARDLMAVFKGSLATRKDPLERAHLADIGFRLQQAMKGPGPANGLLR